MSYNKITNPLDGRSYSIFEGTGKKVLKKYIKQMKMKQGGSLGDLTSAEYTILTEMNTILEGEGEDYGYTFSKYLGKGGYGIVAEYEKDGKIYAIKSGKKDGKAKDMKTKVINKYITDTIERLQDRDNKFNCNFVLKYKVLETADRDFLISEVFDIDLIDYLMGIYATLSNEKKIKIMKSVLCQLIYAIKCLHGIGITHGDLKPENIFLNFKNKEIPEIKIADIDGGMIDLEKLKDYFIENDYSDLIPELTKIDGITPEYRPYIREKINKSIDIYSIGIIMYVFLKLAFPRRNNLEYIKYGLDNDKYNSEELESFLKESTKNKNLSEFFYGDSTAKPYSKEPLLLSLLADESSDRITAEKLYRDPLIQSMCEEVKENLQQQQDLLPPTPPDFSGSAV